MKRYTPAVIEDENGSLVLYADAIELAAALQGSNGFLIACQFVVADTQAAAMLKDQIKTNSELLARLKGRK